MPFLKKRALNDELMLRQGYAFRARCRFYPGVVQHTSSLTTTRVHHVMEQRKMGCVQATMATPHGVDTIPAIPTSSPYPIVPPDAPPAGLTGSYNQALDKHTIPHDILRTPSDFNGKRPELSPSITDLPELHGVEADVLAHAMAEVDTARSERDVFATWWTKHIFNTRVGRVLFDNVVVRWLFKGMFSDLHAGTCVHYFSV